MQDESHLMKYFHQHLSSNVQPCNQLLFQIIFIETGWRLVFDCSATSQQGSALGAYSCTGASTRRRRLGRFQLIVKPLKNPYKPLITVMLY